ncbi:SDR family oxidoreductase [Elongatibacter sediminis]|uniref:SDR family NAD(P)-dependent oxidoreductase n=1 Tax=Elongatibacter sediminis TaxID=3119006 RepID=A0AAW9R6S2_9GAMM
MKLENSVIVITGAAGGLGSAMARRLAGSGARLALLDMNASPLEELAAEMDLTQDRCLTLECDVSGEDSVDGAMARVREHFGRLDVLVNNAGITRDGLLVKFRDGELQSRMSLEHWRQVVDVNLTGVFLCGRAAAEQMARAGDGGVIVNISSISRHGNMGQTNYSATKAGVQAITVAWSKELARLGIRTASISPGFIRTDLVTAMKPEALEKMSRAIPAGRLGVPDEIAVTVQFIIENDFVNGRDFGIDGGMRL